MFFQLVNTPWLVTDVTLAFEDAQVIPTFSGKETNNNNDTDDTDDSDDSDDTDDTGSTENTENTESTESRDSTINTKVQKGKK